MKLVLFDRIDVPVVFERLFEGFWPRGFGCAFEVWNVFRSGSLPSVGNVNQSLNLNRYHSQVASSGLPMSEAYSRLDLARGLWFHKWITAARNEIEVARFDEIFFRMDRGFNKPMIVPRSGVCLKECFF
ncbi:MAG: hypothetical protein HQM08_25640 [Candidatus Riflebacteria bacterium]|nr:hypothetical protein [Candidatus Riflebacteria bacterium]